MPTTTTLGPLLATAGTVAVAIALHVAGTVAAAAALRVRIRAVRIGAGPLVLRLGRLELRMLPVFSAVQLARHGDGDPSVPEHVCVDRRPGWTHAAIAAAGSATLLLVALASLGAAAWTAFVLGFGQVIAGAIQPFDTGAAAIRAIGDAAVTLPFPAFAGLVAAKLAAIGLLPLPHAGGGQVLVGLARPFTPPRQWPRGAALVGVWLHLGLMAGWAIAAFTVSISSAAVR